MWDLENRIAAELETLSDLKKQIREVIEAVPDTDERMVLKYRYIHGLNLGADRHRALCRRPHDPSLAWQGSAACLSAGASHHHMKCARNVLLCPKMSTPPL